MNSKQLYLALLNNSVTQPFFDGVYSLDLLSDISSKPDLIICNTHPSYKSGEHWLLFFFNKEDESVDFYDSLGKDIYFYGEEIVNFAKTYAHHFNRSTVMTQPKNSSLCGHFCLFYAYHKCKGKRMNYILNEMSSTDKVISFVEKNFSICSSSNCTLLQKCSDC